MTREVSERALAMLRRFPRHLDVARADKLFAEVVDALAEGLECQTTQVGRIRAAHRLRHADEEGDLAHLAATHDLHADDVAIAGLRLAAIHAAAAALALAPSDPAVATARAALSKLLGAPVATFTPWPSEGTELAPAQARLAAAIASAIAYDAELDLLRRRLQTTIALHRAGNGTIGALLGAAASGLDLDVESIRHHAGGFWHLARCRDRIRLERPEPPGARRPTTLVPPDVDLVALEENPFFHTAIEPFDVEHAARFGIEHAGLEAAPVNVTVIGVGEATVHPMVVLRDAGRGVAYRGAVPDGNALVFHRDGAVTLDGADVTGDAWAFTGAVFTQAGEVDDRDFCFTLPDGTTPHGQAATFATAVPYAAAFEPGASWPHAAGDLPGLTLELGQSRWAFFVRAGHFGRRDLGREDFAVSIWQAGVFDASVWHGPPAWTAARLGFDWDEREAFAVKLWLPMRFAALDGPDAAPVRERVRRLLDRHRAAGIHVYVDYASDLWTLGDGILRDLDSEEPDGVIVHGTRVSPS